MKARPTIEEEWQWMLSGDHPIQRRYRPLFRLLPKEPRCKWCFAPFHGLGGSLMNLIGKRPSNYNPRFCNDCERFAKDHLGGVECELTMLFTDVRGSTTLAEQMSTAEFSRLISRFYAVATDAMVQANAIIDKLVGDQASGFFLPGFAGENHAHLAVQTARQILQATGYGQPGGPWIPVGAGVHTGRAFVGAVGSQDGIVDMTALGDAVNITARLSSSAAAGEILVSEETYQAAGLPPDELEQRQLELKGRSQPVTVRVIKL